MESHNSDERLKALETDGYCILPDSFDSSQAAEYGRTLERVYALQRREFGPERLNAIGELGLARAPLSYDPGLLDVALNPSVLTYVQNSIAGGTAVLHSQNGFLYRLKGSPKDSTWHRGSPLKDHDAVTSKPIAICASFFIDDVFADPCMHVLPGSHKDEEKHSTSFVERRQIPIHVARGTVILLDAMLFRRWSPGEVSQLVRVIENTYTIPAIAAEIDFSEAPHVQARRNNDPLAHRILDFRRI